MNEMHVTLRGNLASDPRYVQFEDGNEVTSFRLASTSRYFDRSTSQWVDRETTYVSVNCRRSMAANAAGSLLKGHPVVVSGRMRERFWESGGRAGHTLEIEAEAIGHDLSYGIGRFQRIARTEARPQVDGQQGDDLTAQVIDDANRADGARRTVDVSGFTMLPEPIQVSRAGGSDPGSIPGSGSGSVSGGLEEFADEGVREDDDFEEIDDFDREVATV